MEPVQIDFIIGGNTEEKGSKIEQTLDDITNASKRSITEARRAVKAQKAVVKHIERDIRDIEKKLQKTPFGKQRNAVQTELNAAKRALEEDKAILTAYEGKVDSLSSSHQTLSRELYQTKDALAKMEAEGLRGTPLYDAMAERLGELTDAMTDTNRQAKILADDNRGIKAVTQAIGGLSGGVAAATGAISLFADENEDLVKIQTRLQSLIAITIGLEQVADTLNKDSYARLILVSRAKKMWAKAQAFLNVQLRLGAVASKALMVSGVGLLIVGIGLLVAKLMEWNSTQQAVNKLQQEFKQAQEEGYKAATSQVESVEALIRVAKNMNLPMKKRLEALNKLNEIMPEYNGYLDTETGKLIANKDALLEYVKALGNMEAVKQLSKKNAERTIEIVQLEQKKDDLESGKVDAPVKHVATGVVFGGGSAGYMVNTTEVSDGDKESAHQKNINDAVADADAKIKALKSEQEKTEQLMKKLSKNQPILLSDFKGGSGGSGGTDNQTSKEYDAQKEMDKQLLELQKQTARLLIEQKEDSLEKELALIEANGKDTITKIKSQSQEIVEAYNEANPEAKVKTLFEIDPKKADEIGAEIAKIEEDIKFRKKRAEEKHQQEIANVALNYAEDRVQIEANYAEDIATLRNAGREKEAKAAEAERDNKIAEATANIITETEVYQLASNQRLQISAETTAQLIADIRKRIEVEKVAGKLSEEKARALLDKLRQADNVRKTDNENNPFKALVAGLKAYKKAKDGLAKANANGASITEIAALEDSANKALKGTTEAAAVALQGVENILRSVIQGLDSLGLLTEEEKKDAEDIVGMVSGAADVAMGIASGNPMQIIQGSINLLTNAFSFFDFKSKRIAKQQKALAAHLGELSRQYSKLQREAERALGTDVFKKQREGIENLKRQIMDYQKLIALEQRKKRKKQKQENIESWRNGIREAEMQIEDTITNIRDMLTGTTTHQMADELANALVAAFQQGEDSAEAFGKVFDDVIRNAVLNAFKLKFIQKPIDEYLNNLSEYMGNDNALSAWEKEELARQKERIYKDSKKRFDAISELWEIEDNTSKKGIQGDVHQMSEDTGTALVGAFNAVRLNLATITQNEKNSLDIMGRQLALLEQIKNNTAYCRRLDRMDETLYSLKINGIKMR